MKRLLIAGAAIMLLSSTTLAQDILFRPIQERIVRGDNGGQVQRIEFNFKALVPGKPVRTVLNLGGRDIEIFLEPASPKALGLPEGQASTRASSARAAMTRSMDTMSPP